MSDIGTTCLIPTPETAATVLLHADYNLPAHPPFSSLFRFCLCHCLTVTAVVSFLFQIRRGFCTTQYRHFHHPEAKFAHPDEPGPIVSYSSWDICALWTYVFTLGFFLPVAFFLGGWGLGKSVAVGEDFFCPKTCVSSHLPSKAGGVYRIQFG